MYRVDKSVFFETILPMLEKNAKDVSDEEKLENLTYFLGVSIGKDSVSFFFWPWV
jgi:hypothetical protein